MEYHPVKEISMHYSTKSESHENIVRAFEKESEAHVKYMILKDAAHDVGNEDLAKLYGELAEEEYAHARIWFAEAFDADEEKNLGRMIKDETDNAAFRYPQMASVAESEGYEALADKFLDNANAEASHRARLTSYKTEVADGTRYSSKEEAVWRCCVCGHTHTGCTPPEECPLCGYGETAYRQAED